MIVCICKGVSQSQIDKAMEKGNLTLQSIARACGAGMGPNCGGCHQSLREIIARYQQNSQATAPKDELSCAQIASKSLR